jgi:hypothetical protein
MLLLLAMPPGMTQAPPTANGLNLDHFQTGICDNQQPGISDQDISATGLAVPSLWWTRDQFAARVSFGHKLIQRWLACRLPSPNLPAQDCQSPVNFAGRVDMVVNAQLWSLLDYLERYEFVNQFGMAASACGYNLYIFSNEVLRQPTLLADYVCQFQPEQQQRSCQLRPDTLGKGGFRSQPSGEGFATGSDTGSP